jgi:hypothetical protein
MIKILNKILTDRLEPEAVMKKLDEILHAVNPNAPRITYTFDGFKRTFSPGRIGGGDDGGGEIFKQIGALEQARDWAVLSKLSESQMRERPEWITPYVAAGEAYLQLGNRAKALELLESAEKQIAGNPDYDPIQKPLAQMLQILRGH